MRLPYFYLVLVLVPVVLNAQMARGHDVPLKPWAAPLYWQPNPDATVNPLDQAAPASLVFVAMTPCRVVDTRSGSGFVGAFGQPSLVAGVARTFPIQSSSMCTIPATAQAYSFNVTVVPTGGLGFMTVFPTGHSLPNASTLNDNLGTVVANAAIVPAGTNGSVDVYASSNTDLILDINGYYTQGAVGSTGQFNTSIGTGALASNTTGTNNTATGSTSLLSNTTGSANTANGYGALTANSTGSSNTANGALALTANTTGYGNAATGYQALDSNTSGFNNTANGFQALFTNSSGVDNTAMGSGALYNTTGSFNIGMGYNAGVNVTTGYSSIMIGNQGVAGDDHTIRIGDVQTRTFIAGITGVNVSGVPVVVSSSGQLGIASSSRRFKKDIEDMGDATANLMRLRPVTYRYKQPFEDGSQPMQYGLIAEEVAEVYPELVAHSADGKIETVKYQVLNSMLLNEVQKLHTQNTAQQEQLTTQTEEIRSLQQRLARLESLIEKSTAQMALR